MSPTGTLALRVGAAPRTSEKSVKCVVTTETVYAAASRAGELSQDQYRSAS